MRDHDEYDPLGSAVGPSDPFAQFADPTFSDINGSDPLYTEGGNPLNPKSGCAVGGRPILCDLLREWERQGALMMLGDNEWGTEAQRAQVVRQVAGVVGAEYVWEDEWADYFIAGTGNDIIGAGDIDGGTTGTRSIGHFTIGQGGNRRNPSPLVKRTLLTSQEVDTLQMELIKLLNGNERCRTFIERMLTEAGNSANNTP